MKDNDIRSFFNSKSIKEKINVNNISQIPITILNVQDKKSSPTKVSDKPSRSKKRKCAEV
jgi:hypothetical protein